MIIPKYLVIKKHYVKGDKEYYEVDPECYATHVGFAILHQDTLETVAESQIDPIDFLPITHRENLIDMLNDMSKKYPGWQREVLYV